MKNCGGVQIDDLRGAPRLYILHLINRSRKRAGAIYKIRQIFLYVTEDKHQYLNRYACTVAEGNVAAFETIYRKILHRAFIMVKLHVSNPSDYDDVLQELMLKAIKLCYTYDPERGNYENYVFRTFRFSLLNHRLFVQEKLRREQPLDFNSKEILNIVDTDETRQPELTTVYYDYFCHLADSGRFSYLEKAVIKALIDGRSPFEVRETLDIDEASYTNTFYRVRQKVRRHPLMTIIDNESQNSYSI